ncbi:SCO family protein [Motiliproteus sediminis]|uniref:SCO family protein n=1 Tax=Motiliproteus sediminis TaxID=1468178 RepID=UPI001AEF5772|nr:SCO family protein [Motiliproteus sediminis]
MTIRLNRLERFALVLTLLLAALSAGLYFGASGTSDTPDTAPGSNGFGGDFTLQSPTGPLALHDLQGQVVVLMFGYSSCPDVCPTGLANVAAALDQLTPAELEQVQPLFISVDPERDTPERLAQYAPYFHPKIIGLTGDLDALSRIALSYGAFFLKVELQNSALGYAVDHTARIYLLDATGQMRALMDHNAPPALLATALRELLPRSSPEKG